jgi:hypothetical protein
MRDSLSLEDIPSNSDSCYGTVLQIHHFGFAVIEFELQAMISACFLFLNYETLQFGIASESEMHRKTKTGERCEDSG